MNATEKVLRELLTRSKPPQWICEMVDYYRQHGTYRPEDLYRLLGDQTVGVGLNTTPADVVKQHTQRR